VFRALGIYGARNPKAMVFTSWHAVIGSHRKGADAIRDQKFLRIIFHILFWSERCTHELSQGYTSGLRDSIPTSFAMNIRLKRIWRMGWVIFTHGSILMSQGLRWKWTYGETMRAARLCSFRRWREWLKVNWRRAAMQLAPMHYRRKWKAEIFRCAISIPLEWVEFSWARLGIGSFSPFQIVSQPSTSCGSDIIFLNF